MSMNSIRQWIQNFKGKSIFEVLLVFILLRLILWPITATEYYQFELELLGWVYSIQILVIVILLGILLLTKRNFESYGITSKKWRSCVNYGLVAAGVVFLPAYFAFGLVFWIGSSYTELIGAIILALAFVFSTVVLLLFLKWRDQRKPENFNGIEKEPNTAFNLLILGFCLLLPIFVGLLLSNVTTILISTIVWQFVISGFGEEFIYRGYYQSRINEEFGHPYKFLGVEFGIGLIISSFLFGISHALNPFNPFAGNFEIAVWWGVFTFFSGLFFGFIREKTKSLIAPSIAHGLPDAIGEAFGILFEINN